MKDSLKKEPTKPFWFALNVTVWLSSKSVRLMSLAERGSYITLLALAWGEDIPGTLPVDEDEVRRMAEMSPEQWALSGPRLLKKFPISECGSYRYNPRLLAEGQEQKRKSELAAEAGRKSAEAKKQRKGNGMSTDVAKKPTDVEKTATERQLVTDTITSSTDVEERGQDSSSTSALKAEKEKPAIHPAAAHAESLQADTFSFAESFFAKPDVYAAVLRDLGFADVDAAHYAREIRLHSEEKGDRLMMSAWRKRLLAWLKNDKARGCLLLAAGNGIRPASPDPEADRLRAAQPVALPQPTAGYVPYVSKPNLPGTIAEPAPTYGPASTARQF